MIQAVRDVSFEVNEGEVVSLIGANGAGKTTILRTLSALFVQALVELNFWDKKSKRCLHRRLWHQDFLKYQKDVMFSQV